MSTNPNYASVNPRTNTGTILTANTARDGTGTGPATPIFTGAASGSKVEEIRVKATAAIAVAGMVRIYIYDGSGTDAALLTEFPVPVTAADADTATFEDSKKFDNLLLQSGFSITASTEKGDAFKVHVSGADFA